MNILITGGASGLGKAITIQMASNDTNHIYFTYVKSYENAQLLLHEFSNCSAIKCDFTEQADVLNLCNSVEELGIDVLINNAYHGSFIGNYFHKTKSDSFLEEFKTNIIPTLQITQSCLLHFRKKKAGKIITILSAALEENPPLGSSIYVSNKAYLQELSKVWAVENNRFGITSNCISPSMMRTHFTEKLDERIVEQITANHPLKKLLTEEEVAHAVEFLTKASNHMNGTTILMNAASSV